MINWQGRSHVKSSHGRIMAIFLLLRKDLNDLQGLFWAPFAATNQGAASIQINTVVIIIILLLFLYNHVHCSYYSYTAAAQLSVTWIKYYHNSALWNVKPNVTCDVACFFTIRELVDGRNKRNRQIQMIVSTNTLVIMNRVKTLTSVMLMITNMGIPRPTVIPNM